jgi:hypothetical protein
VKTFDVDMLNSRVAICGVGIRAAPQDGKSLTQQYSADLLNRSGGKINLENVRPWKRSDFFSFAQILFYRLLLSATYIPFAHLRPLAIEAAGLQKFREHARHLQEHCAARICVKCASRACHETYRGE